MMRLLDPDVLNDGPYLCDWDGVPPRPVRHRAVDEEPYDDRIRLAYERGEPLKVVARELGITKNALIGRARNLRLVWKKPRPARWAQ